MKRKHHDAIVAWAGGAKIEFRNPIGSNVWIDSENPAWLDDYEYRVKPAREYPTTRMTREEMVEVVRSTSGGFSDSYASLVNAGLRHAIDAGQVVTREEFDALAEECKCATNSLIAAGYTYRGGELWKPPLGNAYAERQARDLKVVNAVIEHFRPTLEMFNFQVPQAWQLQAVIREWVK